MLAAGVRVRDSCFHVAVVTSPTVAVSLRSSPEFESTWILFRKLRTLGLLDSVALLSILLHKLLQI